MSESGSGRRRKGGRPSARTPASPSASPSAPAPVSPATESGTPTGANASLNADTDPLVDPYAGPSVGPSGRLSAKLSADAPGYTLGELVEAVNAWCVEARLVPANGQVGEVLTERNLRFYRTVGILDAPLTTGGGGYAEKHRLQLMALRLLQAQGLPLRRIRELLFGRTERELRGLRDRGLEALARWVPRGVGVSSGPDVGLSPVAVVQGAGSSGLGPWAAGEAWTVVPVNGEFAVICRSSQQVSADKLRRVRAILEE